MTVRMTSAVCFLARPYVPTLIHTHDPMFHSPPPRSIEKFRLSSNIFMVGAIPTELGTLTGLGKSIQELDRFREKRKRKTNQHPLLVLHSLSNHSYILLTVVLWN